MKAWMVGTILLFACSEQPESSAQTDTAPLNVYSFSYPTSYLVDRLAGDSVKHRCILPAGEDAAFWKPSTDLIIELQQADLLFSNGLGFEGWVKTAALPSSKLIETAGSVKPIEMVGKTHSHGKGGAHSHGEIDPHAWSDPSAYIQMAEAVAKALYTERPDLKTEVESNLGVLKTELTELDAQNDRLFAEIGTINFAANHPSYSYLMRSQKIDIENFDLDPEGELDAGEVNKLETWSQGRANIVLLWEAKPLPDHTTKLVGLDHYTIDPLEAPLNGTYDYIAQYKANQERFSQIIQAHSADVKDSEPVIPAKP